MNEKELFEQPVIETYRRDELLVETVFTGTVNSHPI